MSRFVASLLAVFALPVLAAHSADGTGAAADGVLEAIRAADAEALGLLAAADAPDPWLVADELCARGEFEAASAFASAASRFDTERLAEYVAAQRAEPTDPARREAAAAIARAVQEGELTEAVDLSENLPPEPIDVTAVRARESRGEALLAMRQYREGSAAFQLAADMTERLGWWTRHSWLLHQTAVGAYRSGDWQVAVGCWTRRLALEEKRADLGLQAVILGNLGIVHRSLGKGPRAIECHRRALELERRRAVPASLAQALINLGATYYANGSLSEALETTKEAVRVLDGIGEPRKLGEATGNLGLIHGALGHYAKSLACHERALAVARELGDTRGESKALTNSGMMQFHLGRYAEALRNQRAAREIFERLRSRRGVAHTLRQEAQVHTATGAYDESLRCLEAARRIFESMRLAPDVVHTLGSIADVYSASGRFAEALRYRDRSLKLAELIRHRLGIAYALQDITHIHEQLGNYEEAERSGRRALTLMEEMRDRTGTAMMLRALGAIHGRRGNYEESMRCHKRALEILEQVGDARGADSTRLNIGLIHAETGDYEAAKRILEPVLARATGSNRPRVEAIALTDLATVHARLGQIDEALELHDRAIDIGRRIGAEQLVVTNLWGRARGYCLQKRYAAAIEVGRDALRRSAIIVGRLPEEESALARGAWIRPAVDVGVRAAMELNDPAEVCFFLESGRAGALIESLGGRAAMSAVALPQELLGAERTARTRFRSAQRDLENTRRSGDRKAIRTARAALSRAQEILADVAARVQRESKVVAGLVYARADELEDIRSYLTDGDALVHYAAIGRGDAALALVVTPTTTRVVELCDFERIEKACATLRASDPRADPGAAVEALRKLAVAPLALEDSTRRLLICPHAALSYLPFTLLAPDREVAYVPSGTTLGFLVEQARERGETVLALGDPQYGSHTGGLATLMRSGGKLTPLPASREEAEAVGDVVLLGAQATVAGLTKASEERKRWRAVHLACHGSVNTDRPLLSSLALTDSFLTPLDIFRMRIDADLAVLSACETAKGKAYRAEGVIGFTRAFMFAGTPRVIVSLWRVDDEATRALMVKFYELWKPGEVTTSAALKLAQKHVASRERWRHPHYWAAWQLWGVPD